jgi:hypothetical protein
VAILPDHHHLLIGGERDDINPVPRFDHIEIMFGVRSGREGGIRAYGEDAEGLYVLRSNAWPRFDHLISPLLKIEVFGLMITS